jgi:hypothetical protein
MIKKYIEFIKEELNPKKLSQMKNDEVSDLFTASIEIELEMLTDLKSKHSDKEYTQKYLENTLLNIIRNSIKKELSRSVIYTDSKENNDFLEDCLSTIIDVGGDDEEIESWIDDIKSELDDQFSELEEELNESDEIGGIEIEKEIQSIKDKLFILDIFDGLCASYLSDNFQQLEKKFKRKFPIFIEKWGSKFKFELDNTLDNGIELSNKTYFNSINELVDCIHDFYLDYDSSPNVKGKRDKHFSFKKTTGIHINLGFTNKNSNLNLIKGLLFLDDLQKDKKHIPYVFKNMESRVKSDYVGSLKPVLLNNVDLLGKSLDLLKDNKINECENLLNSHIMKILTNQTPYGDYKFTYKNFGLNLLPLEKYQYIEFRYTGHKIEEEVLIDKIYYFAYIMWSMSEVEMDREEYLKKLYKFLTPSYIPKVKEYNKKEKED